MVASVFFRIVISVMSRAKRKKYKGRLSVWWLVHINIVSKNHTQKRKIERGMAYPPLWR